MSAGPVLPLEDASLPPLLGCESCGLVSVDLLAGAELERPAGAHRIQKCSRCSAETVVMIGSTFAGT